MACPHIHGRYMLGKYRKDEKPRRRYWKLSHARVCAGHNASAARQLGEGGLNEMREMSPAVE